MRDLRPKGKWYAKDLLRMRQNITPDMEIKQK